jgi:hypothetical protein
MLTYWGKEFVAMFRRLKVCRFLTHNGRRAADRNESRSGNQLVREIPVSNV